MLTFAGCELPLFTTGIARRLAMSGEIVSVYETLIFYLVVCRTYKMRQGYVLSSMVPLAQSLIRDGALYYGAMVLVNVANSLTFYLAQPLSKGCLTTLTASLSMIMLARLVFNLRGLVDSFSQPSSFVQAEFQSSHSTSHTLR